jgi:hypothetical protein
MRSHAIEVLNYDTIVHMIEMMDPKARTRFIYTKTRPRAAPLTRP